MGARPRLAVLFAGIVAASGGILYATPAIPCACSTPGYAAPFNIALPVVTGATVVGSVLTTTNGTWANDVSSGYTYQWVDDNGNISGATSSTYTIGAGEVGLHIHAVVTATGVGGAKSASSNSVGPVSSTSGLSANEWISPTGSDSGVACIRNASPVAAPTASTACATPQKACSLASASDVIGVIAGTYGVGFNLTSCSTVTFQTTPHAFASFAPQSSIAGATNVTLQGDDVGHGVGFSLANTSVSSTVSGMTWNDINLYCATTSPYIVLTSTASSETACNSAVSINATNFTWNGGDQEDWAVCLAQCSHTGSSSNPNDDFVNGLASNILLENLVFKNYWAMDPTGLTPPLHSELWFLNGGTGITFQNDQMTDCAPPASTGYPVNTSCNTSVIFVGQTGSGNESDDVSVIQNIIAGGHANQKAFQWGHEKPAGHEYTFTAYYNSFDGSLTLCGVSANPCDGSTITGANITWVGNVGILSSVGCFSAATSAHNTWFNSAGNSTSCSGTDQHFNSTPNTNFWSSPGPTSYNYSPLSPIQGKGENTVCATLPNGEDIFGNPRPTTPTACDDGAVNH